MSETYSKRPAGSYEPESIYESKREIDRLLKDFAYSAAELLDSGNGEAYTENILIDDSQYYGIGLCDYTSGEWVKYYRSVDKSGTYYHIEHEGPTKELTDDKESSDDAYIRNTYWFYLDNDEYTEIIGIKKIELRDSRQDEAEHALESGVNVRNPLNTIPRATEMYPRRHIYDFKYMELDLAILNQYDLEDLKTTLVIADEIARIKLFSSDGLHG